MLAQYSKVNKVYYKKQYTFTKTYLEPRRKYCRKQKEYRYSQVMTLLRIPAECSTEKIDISENHATAFVLQGSGICRAEHYEYYCEEWEDPQTWHKFSEVAKMRKGHSRGFRCNQDSIDNPAPSNPWVQFENTAQKDLLIFFSHTNRNEQIKQPSYKI